MKMFTVDFSDGSEVKVEAPEDASDAYIMRLAERKKRLERESARETKPLFTPLDLPESEPDDGTMLGRLARGTQAGFVGTFETAALGAGTLLGEDAETAARDKIMGIASVLKPSDAGADALSYKIGQAFGSIGGFAAGIAGVAAAAPVVGVGAGLAGTAAGLGLGVNVAKGEASERARAAGATPEERQRAVNDPRILLAGAAEALPISRIVPVAKLPFVGKLINDLGPQEVTGIGQKIQRAAITGGAEGAQEAASEVVQNLVERGYNPDRAVFDSGTAEAGALGGTAGAALQFLVDSFANTRRAGPTSTGESPAEQQIRALLAEELPNTDGALTAELANQVKAVEGVDGIAPERVFEIIEEEAAKIPERQGPPESAPSGEMSNLRRTAVQAMQRQADRGPEFVSSRERVTDLSDLGIGSLTANQELIDTRKEVREELERTGDVTFDREKLAARNIPINKFEQIVKEERAKTPERQGPDQRVAESYKGQREDQDDLMAAVGREKARRMGQEPITRTEPLLLPKPNYTIDEGEPSGSDTIGELSSPPTPDDTGRRESDARNQQSMGARQAKDTGAKKPETSETDGLGDVRRDAVDTTTAKGTQPSALDKATAVRVQQWWNDTQEGGGLRILSDLSESREEKLAQQYADRARAAYDQKYGIRPNEVGLPHRRTPSARWGGQDFVEAKKEAEALGDSEMLQAINEIERTNIELGATRDINSRAREDSARELKELFPEYAAAIDADLRGFVEGALNQKIDRIEPKFTPESKQDRPVRQVVPGTRYKVDPKTLKRTGKVTFVDDPSLAPKKSSATQKSQDVSSADKIAEQFNRKATPAQRRNAKEIPVTSNPFSEEVNARLFKKVSGAKDAVNEYLTKYPNPADGIREAYYTVINESGAAGSKRARRPDTEQYGRDEDPTSARQREELERGSSFDNAKKTVEFMESMPMSRMDRTILNEIKNAAQKDPKADFSPDLIDDVKNGGTLYAAVNKLKIKNEPLEAAIDAGDIDTALDILSKTKGFPKLKAYAIRFKQLLKGSGIKLTTKKNLKDGYGDLADGIYDPETKTITLDKDKGRDAHALMHEIAHALTLRKIEQGVPVAIQRLFKEVQKEFDGEYGSTDIKEFFSEAMSNPEFRSSLSAMMNNKNISYLQMAENFIATRILGEKRNLESLDDFDAMTMAILNPTPPQRLTGKIALGTRDNVKKVAKDIGDVQRKLVKDFDKQEFVDTARDFLDSAKTLPRRIYLKLVANQGLADIAQVSGFNRLGFDLDNAILRQRGSITTATEATRKVVEEVQGIFKRMGNAKVAKLDELIYSQDFGATIYQVDAFLPQAEAIKAYKDKQSDDPNKTKLDIWNEQQKFIRDNGLRGDGQLAYKKMRDHYKEQFERARKIVLKEIDELGKEAGDPELVKKVKKDIYAKLFDAGTLEVYFPLVREGNYKLSYGVKNAPNARAEYVVEMFTTKAERDRAFREIKADPRFENVQRSQGEATIEDYQKAPPTSFVFEVVNSLSKAKVDNKAIEEVMRLFVATLPETSFAKSLQKRKGTPGYKEDSMYALRTKGYDLAVQAQKLKSASEIRLIEQQIENTKQPADVPDTVFEDMKAELLGRARFARQGAKNKSIEDVGRRLNQFAFIYTIGFNASSALVNGTQIPLFVMPYLGAKYGYAQTTKAIKEAGSITINVKNSLRDFYDMDLDGNISLKADPKMSDAMRQKLLDLMPLVKVAAERGQLVSQSYLAESMGLDEAARAMRKDTLGGLAGSIMDKISGISAYMFNHVEKFNRQNTMIAAYNLHIDKLTQGKGNPTAEQQMEAAEEAIYMTQEANGGAYLETGPSIARENIGRVAMMYKSYGLQMYYSMFKQAKRMVDKELPPEQRKEAFKILLGLHGSAIFFAGLQGIPLYGAVRLVANMFFLDDEEEDFDTLVRKQVGEGWYKGPLVAMTGLDTASRTALTGLLIQENKYNPDPSLEETIGFYIGGPALSTANRIKRGIEDLGDGQIERGIENLMPTAVANAMKSLGRYSREGGAFSRRGDPIYDDMTTGELMGVLFGIQPAGYTQASDQNRILKGIDKAVTTKRSALSKKYYIALRQNDAEEVDNVLREMQKFNQRHPEASITPKSLKRSLNQHMQTSVDMYQGVALSPTYRNALLELASGWQDLTD